MRPPCTVSRSLPAAAALWSLCGCAAHHVEYHPFVGNWMTATDHAVVLHGEFEAANQHFEQAQLPHNSPRRRFELHAEGLAELTEQLGAPDYVLIGEISGRGTEQATMGTLMGAITEKAAAQGGDVVMIIHAGVLEQPYIHSTPSYVRTHHYGSAYGCWPYGFSTASTTYWPGTTYTGVWRFPRAHGLVFKYVPGVEQRRQALAGLDDARMLAVLEDLDALSADDSLSIEEVMDRWDDLLTDTP